MAQLDYFIVHIVSYGVSLVHLKTTDDWLYIDCLNYFLSYITIIRYSKWKGHNVFLCDCAVI